MYAGSNRMNEKTLEVLIDQTMGQCGSGINITWQGGEPTLMGLDFFKRVVELEAKYGRKKQVSNNLQTNGLLLNTEWADFLNEYNFLVGLSLDGPEHIHDTYRKRRSRKGSFEKVHRSAKMLLERGVDTNILSCITDYSSQYAEEIYHFNKKIGVQFLQFIPIVETDKADPGVAAEFSVSAKAYGAFLSKIFDLWYHDFVSGNSPVSIRHIESIFFRYVGFEAPECPLKEECGTYLVVEHNGDVYPCDFFVEPAMKLGNIHKDRLIDMLNSSAMVNFGQMKMDLPSNCSSCKWKPFCYGGCTKDRVRDPRDKRNNHFCDSYQMFLEHAHPYLSELAKSWKEQNKARQQTYDASGHFR